MTTPEPAQTTTLPCAVCLKRQERMDGQPEVPYGANIFMSQGHYGATAFDSPGGEYLELLICTPCLHIMKGNSAIHRVLLGTEARPGTWSFWGSEEDPDDDNPWNKQRVRNEFAMADFFDAAPEAMDDAWAKTIFDACMAASHEGRPFDPATIPAPAEVPGV